MEPEEIAENSSKNEEQNPHNKERTNVITQTRARCPCQGPKELKQQEEIEKWSIASLELDEYFDDIFNTWKAIQKKKLIRPDFMTRQASITPEMRSELIHWLSNTVDSLHLPAEVLFLTVHYIDCFLSDLSIMSDRFKLLGLTALHIAAKFEETSYKKKVTDLLELTENSYSKREFLDMELLVLRILRFDLPHPTTSAYLNYLFSLFYIRPKMNMFSLYLCEMSLLDAENFFVYGPLRIACASVALCRFYFRHKPIWEPYFEDTKYTVNMLKDCMCYLNSVHKDAANLVCQNIQKKYSTDKYFNVALIKHIVLSGKCLDCIK